jgi:hypothetical protein
MGGWGGSHSDWGFAKEIDLRSDRLGRMNFGEEVAGGDNSFNDCDVEI